MDNIKKKQSGFKVESILLTESSFTRKGKINFSESEQELSFETGVGSKDNTVNVKLTTTVTNKLKGEEQYRRTRQTLWRAVQMLTKNCCQTIHEEWYVFDTFHLCTEAFDF